MKEKNTSLGKKILMAMLVLIVVTMLVVGLNLVVRMLRMKNTIETGRNSRCGVCTV